jgi:CHAD domain-containing protein
LFVTIAGDTKLRIIGVEFNMAYRLKLREPLGEAVPRILIDQIGRIRREIADNHDSVTAVHETRKCLKRIRALLKLLRPGLASEVYGHEAARYRTIASSLSSSRDRDVIAATLTHLAGNECSTEEAEAIAVVKGMILSETAVIGNNAMQLELITALDQAQIAAGSLIVTGETETLQEGLAAAYRKGRRLQNHAYDDGSDEAFHDLRKAVQLHWRHMQLLQKAWPEMFAARIEAARSLSQMLGDVQDMAVVIAAIKSREDVGDDAAAAVVGVARAAQRKARKLAPPLGEQLFAQSSRSFAKSTIVIWEAAGKLE